MIEFVCTPLPVELHNRVAMVTMHFHIAQMSLCFGTFFFSHSGGPSKIFWNQYKIVMGCKVGQIRFCGIGYPILVLF